MKAILFMAISATGKTTSGPDNTSWVETSDVERMDQLMVDCGVMIMGRSTYESFGDELPLGQALLVIMTRDKNLLKKSQEGMIFTDQSPRDVLTMLEAKGYQRVMLSGGENLNSSFLKDNLINEIRLIVKPMIIGQGKSLFDISQNLDLKLESNTTLTSGNIELIYSIQAK